MTFEFHERIRQVDLDATAEGLELTAADSENEATVVLSRYAVRELRLALARYERLVAKNGLRQRDGG